MIVATGLYRTGRAAKREQQNALLVKCDHCGKGPGEPCKRVGGNIVLHQTRLNKVRA